MRDIKSSKDFNRLYQSGDLTNAEKVYDGTDDKKGNLLKFLNLAMVARDRAVYEKSNDYFNNAERLLIWKSDSLTTADDLAKKGLELISTDLISDYHGQIYEGVLVNSFKAQNYMQLGDLDNARIEFNRAEARSVNAIEQLGEKVNSIKKSTEKSDATAQRYITDSLKNKELQQRRAAVESIGVYKNLRNPYTDYWHGIYRMLTKDFAKSADLLRNADVTSNGNPAVRSNWQLAEQLADSAEPKLPAMVYIMHEDGYGPSFKEFRTDIFVPIGLGSIFSLALPEFVMGKPAFAQQLTIESGGQIHPTHEILDMNNYVNTEFSAQYSAIVTKAVTSGVIKLITQAAVDSVALNTHGNNKSLGALGLLASAVVKVAAVASTQADTRSWTSLPNRVYTASFPASAPTITIKIGHNAPVTVNTPPNAVTIITIKTTSPQSSPIINSNSFSS